MGSRITASFPEGRMPPDSPHSRVHFSSSSRDKKGSPVGQGQPPSPVGASTPWSPRGLLPVALPKQVSTLALGSQVFSQPAPPHLIAFQSANPWPTPSAPARQATSVWPAVASETSHGPGPSLGQPLDSPCPNHILLALPHTSNSPLTNISKPSEAQSSPDPKQQTSSFSYSPLLFTFPLCSAHLTSGNQSLKTMTSQEPYPEPSHDIALRTSGNQEA